MHAGPPEDVDAEHLLRQLAEIVGTFEQLVGQQSDGGRAVVAALTDQLAAGQGEALYGLHDASQAVARRAIELERAAAALPTVLAQRLPALVDELLTEVHAQLSATVEAAQDELVRAADCLVTGVEKAASALAADASAVTQAMERVGENILTRLIATLEDRDHRDNLLESRLNARIDRLTKRTSDTVAQLTAELAAQVDRLHARDVAERAATATELHTLVERLLSERRSTLRSFRSATRQTSGTAEPTPAAPRRKRNQAEDERR